VLLKVGEDMKLVKFPVEGKYYTYQVEISEDDFFGQYIVRLHLREKFLKFIPYWDRVDSKGWDIDKYRGKFVEIAIRTVGLYESYLEQYWENEKIKQQGIEDWNKWNGTMN
jgi:hypothetical protein